MEKIQYWLATSDQEKIGPLSLDELKDNPHLSPDVRIWCQGLTAWVKASELPELARLFSDEALANTLEEVPVVTVRPTAPTAPTAPKRPARPRTYLGWSIAAIILCCRIPAIVAVIYSTFVSSRYSEGDYEGAERASQTAEMWLLVSIVLGIVELPFIIAINIFG